MRKIANHLRELAAVLETKVPHSVDALEYIQVGEYGLALELLSDWCADTDPAIALSSDEVTRFFVVGEMMGLRAPWVELLPLLELSESAGLPTNAIALAREYLAAAKADSYGRSSWLQRVLKTVEQLEMGDAL